VDAPAVHLPPDLIREKRDDRRKEPEESPGGAPRPSTSAPELRGDRVRSGSRVFRHVDGFELPRTSGSPATSRGRVLEENFPVHLRPQGREIVRTWLYYTARNRTSRWEKPSARAHPSSLMLEPAPMHRTTGNYLPRTADRGARATRSR